MSNIIASEVTADYFNWNAEDNIFSQEISVLEDCCQPFGPIWDDACDEGFKMVSVKNPENYVLYVLADTEYHHQELCGWWFTVVPDENTQRMGMLDTKVLIVND